MFVLWLWWHCSSTEYNRTSMDIQGCVFSETAFFELSKMVYIDVIQPDMLPTFQLATLPLIYFVAERN